MKKLFAGLFGLVVGLVGTLRADSVVVFNEIMYHPRTNEPAMEWVELRNQLGVDVDISNWTIENAIYYKFATGSVLKARSYLVVAISNDVFKAATGITNVVGPFTNRLSNGGATLELRNNSHRTMDQVSYGTEGDWPVAPDGSGVSLAKRDPDLASEAPASWTASEQVGGTPGTENFPRQLNLSELPGLVSYWNFNSLGAGVIDQAGQNNGTVGPGVTPGPAGAGTGLVFDGTTNAFVNVGSSLSSTSSITIEAVLLPGWSGSGSAVIFHKGPPRPAASYVETVLTNGPLAYWRLGDTTTTIRDATANAHDGTATAGVTLKQPSLILTDTNDTAVRATGNNRITIPGFEKIGPGGYTVEFWVKVNTLPTGCCQNLVGDG